MGKISQRLARRAQIKAAESTEGLIRVSFTFDGVTHVREHLLAAGEVAHMKQLCKDHGEVAADQIIWRQAVRYAGHFAENVLAVAGKAYVLKNYSGAEQTKPAHVFDQSQSAMTYQDYVKLEQAQQAKYSADSDSVLAFPPIVDTE